MRLRFAFIGLIGTLFSSSFVPSSFVRAAGDCSSTLTPLRDALFLERTGPQGIVRDPSDGSYWITLALSLDLVRVSADLSTVEVIPTELPPDEENIFDGLRGIAYDESRDTFLVIRPILLEIAELNRDGSTTGRIIPLDLPRPPTLSGLPGPKGLTICEDGNLWIVESSMTRIYEIDPVDGSILSQFCHPNDPDGCPGGGASAPAHGIQSFNEEDGEQFFDLIGGARSKDRIFRVDREGNKTGLEYDLGIVGGVPAGFLRTDYEDPDTGDVAPAFLVLVESSAELHVLAIDEPDSIAPFDLELSTAEGASVDVDLAWRNGDGYNALSISRDGEMIAELARDAEAFRDSSPPHGVLDYRVVAEGAACTSSVSESVVIGAGRVLDQATLEDSFAIDLTEDIDGQLWVAIADNRLAVFDKDLNLLETFPGPFGADEDAVGGIAYDSKNDTILVYNNVTHEVAEVDVFGEATGRFFASGITPADGFEVAGVTAMLHDPDGDGGNGSLWYLDVYSSMIYEGSLDGQILRSCRHPDAPDEFLQPESGLVPYVWGLSSFPAGEFSQLEVPSGTIRERRTMRLSRLDVDMCEVAPGEVPLADVESVRIPFALAIHRSEHDGRPVIYAINVGSSTSLLLKIDGTEPALGHVQQVSCDQPDDARDVHLSFRADPTADSVEIQRDGEVIATVAASETGFIDEGLEPGLYEYRLVAFRGEERSDDRTCSLRVGPGSFAERVFANPFTLLRDVAYDAVTNSYYAATSVTARARTIQVFDESFHATRAFDSGFGPLYHISTLAVRETLVRGELASEIYCLAWQSGSGPGQTRFPVRVLDSKGRFRREVTFVIPPPESVFVTFPSSMVWDRELDSFWVLEKNSKIVYRFSPDGEILSKFRHPAPPFQDNIPSFGFAIDSARGALYFTTAGPGDSAPSKIVELTRRGELTGVEIPFDATGYNRTWGLELHPNRRSFILLAGSPKPWEFRVVRAFDPLAPIDDLRCVPAIDPETEAEERLLTWANEDQYDGISVYRGDTEVDSLPGSATQWTDTNPSPDETYRLVAWKGELRAASAICTGEAGALFQRGDVEADGIYNLSDAVRILGFLFLGAETPSCLDAVDVDDDGTLNINDAIRLLNYLFLGGAGPEAPFDEPGRDWTVDEVTCVGELRS